MKWQFWIATMLVLTPSVALGEAGKLSAKYTEGKIVVTSSTALDATCWEPLDGKPDGKSDGKPKRYALKNAKEKCIEELGLPEVEPVKLEKGSYTIGGNSTAVKLVLDQDGPAKTPARPGKQSPFVIVHGSNDDIGFVETIDGPAGTGSTQPKGTFDACDWRAHQSGDVRIDLPRGSVEHAPPRNVVQPNHALVVHVCHDRGQDVSAQWAGARGLTRSGLTSDFKARNGGKAGGDSAPKPVEISTMRFPPRQAGSADLKVYEGTDTTKEPLLLVELEVEPLYWGAVRFGLGTLFGNWRGYEIATVSGSRTQEVRQNRNAATFELVSGFAPYLFDLHTGGRSQSGGPNKHFAPFIGFGVLGASPDQGIQGLSSVHIGIEIEVANNFSIAATFAYRRTRKLAAGYDVGSPVEMGMTADNITTDHWEPGFGLVINASPSFLQFATGKSSTTPEGGSK